MIKDIYIQTYLTFWSDTVEVGLQQLYKTPHDSQTRTSNLSETLSSMQADTLLFVALLLLKVRLRRAPGRSEEKVDIGEGVDDDKEDTEADIDEAADIDAVLGRCVKIELEEI